MSGDNKDLGEGSAPPASQDRAASLRPQPASQSSRSGIPGAAIAPMPEPKRIAAIARIATAGMDGLVGPPAWHAAEVAARHGYLFGWYAALECSASLDQETLQAAASAMSASGQDPKGLEAKPASAAPEGGDAQ